MHSTERQPRLALVGGCGSSGTTLLAHLLSRHSNIVSGPELDFFNHPETWSPRALAAAVDDLFARRRLSSGYKLVVDFCNPAPAFDIDASLVAAWAGSSSGIADLCNKLAAHVAASRGADWFVEKTPTNVYAFDVLSQSVPGMPLIHQIRDGRDVAASLLRRGKTLFHAGSRWLYDTLAGLRARGREGYVELRYEDLVTDPRAALERILASLGLPYEDAMLAGSSAGAACTGEYLETWRERAAPKHWTSVPSDAVSSESIGCHVRELSPEQLSTLYRIRLTDRSADELGAAVRTFGELLHLLGYAERPQRLEAGFGARIDEAASELVDYVRRAKRTLRYTARLPRVVTRIAGDAQQ